MRYVREFSLILAVSFVGEILHALIPFPVPASIYGLVLMFLALSFKIVKPGAVSGAGHFLMDIMPLLFVPSVVGVMTVWNVLAPIFLPISVIMVVSTVLVMAASGSVTQAVLRRKSVCAAKESVRYE